MAIHRGIQSALFYYLSCAPCTEARTRRQRRRDADLLRAEKEAQSEVYTSPAALLYPSHPLPSHTNPGWDLEIALGPSKESKATAKQRAKKEGQEVPPRSSASTTRSDRGKKPSITDSPDDLAAWAQTFQRPDGIYTLHTRTSAAAMRGKADLATLPETSALRITAVGDSSEGTAVTTKVSNLSKEPLHSAAWSTRANPSLNDLHPPTVTKYESTTDVSWILEPPPSAKVMRGLARERPRIPIQRTASRTASARGDENHTAIITPGDEENDTLSPVNLNGAEDVLEEYTPDENDYAAIDFTRIRTRQRDSVRRQSSGDDDIGQFVFPAKQDWLRRDSATTGEEDWEEHPRDRIELGPQTGRKKHAHHVDPRWRWSNDW